MAKLLVRCLISARNTVIASEIICRLGYFAIYLEVNHLRQCTFQVTVQVSVQVKAAILDGASVRIKNEVSPR